MTKSISDQNYIEAATNAGYDNHDDLVLTAEFEDRFLIINVDDEDEYMVGFFFKPTEDHCGDYSGTPLYQGTLHGALEAFVEASK